MPVKGLQLQKLVESSTKVQYGEKMLTLNEFLNEGGGQNLEI